MGDAMHADTPSTPPYDPADQPYDAQYAADLHEQLCRMAPIARLHPPMQPVVDRIVAAVKAEERKRGRHRIRQPGCADVAAYGWRCTDPSLAKQCDV